MRARRSTGLRAMPLLAATLVVSLSTVLGASTARADEAATLARLAPDLSRTAISEALTAMQCAKAKGLGTDADRLAIVDYTRPSTQRRLWIFDLQRKALLFKELVAHGKKSGDDVATEFSNRNGSYKSSLGLFLTDEAYEGGHGPSMKLVGLSGKLNDAAMQRKIVLHGAWYVDADHAERYGRLGRSLGCPAVRPQVATRIIDTLKEGQFLYAYGPGSSAAKKCENIALASNTVPAPRGNSRR